LEYVIVHELAHLRENNHSPRFWAIVADALPDYKARQAKMKALAWLLNA
jgi:predicted metal-dependent hydrolase